MAVMSSASHAREDGSSWVQFGDVVRQVKDEISAEASGLERFVAGEHMDSDDPHLRRWGLIEGGYLGPAFRRRFRKGDVLYGSRRTYLRKVSVAPFDGICANTTFVCEPADERLSSALLPHLMQCEGFHAHSVARSRGSVNPYVTWKDIASYGFWLPPKRDQQRIAQVLDQALSSAEAYKAACYGLGVAVRTKLATAFDPPHGSTRTAHLRDVCSMQNGRPFPSGDYTNVGPRLLRPGNLAPSGYLSWSESATKNLPERYLQEASDFVVDSGDVIINLTAQSLEDGFMGRVCIARDGDECLLNQRIGRFICSNDILPEYLSRVLQAPAFRHRAESRCGGSKIRHLYWAHIEDFQIPVPSLEAQHEHIAGFRSLDHARNQMEVHAGKLTALMTSLRAKLLDLGQA